MTLPPDRIPNDPYLELLSEAFRGQQAATTRILGTERGSAAIRLLMEDAVDRAHRHGEAALRLSPPTQPLACRKGCHYCCWATVGVVAPEAIYLADELRPQLSEDELARLTSRANRMGRRLRAMDRGARLDARVPCALLRNGSCSAYERRPLACRWATSPGLQGCLDLLVSRTKPFLEMEDVRYQATQEVWRGLRAGLDGLGLESSLLALNCALPIALSDPGISRKYLEGEPVFDEAHLE